MPKVCIGYLWCIQESVNWAENQGKRKDHTENKLPQLQLYPMLQLSRQTTLPSTNSYLFGGMVVAPCKSVWFSLVGGNVGRGGQGWGKFNPKSLWESRNQAGCFSSQMWSFLPRGKEELGELKEAVLLSKVKHLEIWNFSALPQTFQSLRTTDAAQPLRKPRRRYWDTEHQRHLLNLVPDNATLFPILNLLEFLCILGSCF